MSAFAVACGESGELVIAPVVTPTPGPNVAFVDVDGSALHAGADRTLTVAVDPAGPATVRFALLGDVGDASLDVSQVDADANGSAHVTVHAPTRPTTLTVRAAIDGGGSAQQDIAIVGGAVGTLAIRATYTGTRTLPMLDASAYPQGSCASFDLPTQPLGDLVANGAANGDPITLANVPAEERVAVLVRAGGVAVGCVDLATPLTVGETRPVTVPLANTTLHTSTASLDIALSVTTDPATFTTLIQAWALRFSQAFLGGAPSAGSALLDAMEAGLDPANAAAFHLLRTNGDWDAAVNQLFGVGGAEIVTQTWVPQATASIVATPGAIDAHLTANGDTASVAFQRLMRLDATVDPLATPTLPWAADANDELSLGAGVVSFGPSRLIARAVEDIALTAHPDADGAITALRKETSCDDVVKAIIGVSTPLYAGCDDVCASSLCSDALATMWNRALVHDETAAIAASLELSVAGAAAIDADANIVGFNGTWSGTLTDASLAMGGTSKLKGAVAATTPKP